MIRQTLLALTLCGCLAAPLETGEDHTPSAYAETPKAPEWGPERDPGPNPCGPAGVKGGVEIPVECYDGPPRHDDVEQVVNPYDQTTPQHPGSEQSHRPALRQ